MDNTIETKINPIYFNQNGYSAPVLSGLQVEWFLCQERKSWLFVCEIILKILSEVMKLSHLEENSLLSDFEVVHGRSPSYVVFWQYLFDWFHSIPTNIALNWYSLFRILKSFHFNIISFIRAFIQRINHDSLVQLWIFEPISLATLAAKPHLYRGRVLKWYLRFQICNSYCFGFYSNDRFTIWWILLRNFVMSIKIKGFDEMIKHLFENTICWIRTEVMDLDRIIAIPVSSTPPCRFGRT